MRSQYRSPGEPKTPPASSRSIVARMGNAKIIEKLGELIRTGIPELAHRLHDQLDSTSSSYLWKFLTDNWATLESSTLTQHEVLDRLIHRRAAVQLGRLQTSADGPVERSTIEGAEFYLLPRIAKEVRLGQMLKRGDEYRVVMTPHCHLVVQPGQDAPRADYVLTAKTVAAKVLFEEMPLRGSPAEKIDNLRRRIQSPAGFRLPRGLYWFLPGFFTMPDLYVHFLQLESVEYKMVVEEDGVEKEDGWTTFAVLDTPFAEALQSCFVGFYSAVGLPSLDPSHFPDLRPPEAATTPCGRRALGIVQ